MPATIPRLYLEIVPAVRFEENVVEAPVRSFRVNVLDAKLVDATI